MTSVNASQKPSLPPKELSLFKRIVKSYEHKQYKNGLKFARQIFSNPKFAEHGETLAMKGLILNCIGKKEEAYECCKKGLQNDLKSSICWHVYGLIKKSDRKYDEAIKCYLHSLRLDKENMQILRDLSLLQIQMRDLEGYKDTRYKLFLLRPSHKASWIGYAMAHHLLDNKDTSLNILEEFRKAQTQVKAYDYEHSELLLYQVTIMIESGKLTEALDHINSYKSEIVDHLAIAEFNAEILLKMENYEEAAKVYWELIDRNPENKSYYLKLEEALKKTTPEDKQTLYNQIVVKYPRASVPKKIPLEFLSGEEFRRHADSFLKPALRKGVPPLFILLKALYDYPEKVAILEKLYLDYQRFLGSCERLSDAEESEDNPLEPPTTLIWTNYLLAQHYSFIGKIKEAIELVDQQLQHTPTLIEFYALKGQIYRDAGDLWTASLHLKEAQSLDTADRYINSQCTLYLIQADRVQEAEEMAAKFTREGTPSCDHLNEMQCMWYLTEASLSYRRMGKLGEALKKAHEVERHFSVMMEDQFDFHSYCLRKMTLRSYVEMIRLEDKLRSHPFYFIAAKNAIEIYIQLFEHPVEDEDSLENSESKNLSASELKKLRNKQRKAKKKAEQEAARVKVEQEKREAVQRSKQNADKDQEGERSTEEKIDPAKLVRPEKPLEEAVTFLQPLLDLASNNIETQCLAYEVYERKEKPLLMLRAIKRGIQLGERKNPWFHRCYLRFLLFVTNNRDRLSCVVRQVVDQDIATLYPAGQSPTQLNNSFLEENKFSLPHLLSGAIVKYKIDFNTKNCGIDKIVKECQTLKEFTWQKCQEVLESVTRGDLGPMDSETLEEIRSVFAGHFPFSAPFFTASQLVELRREPPPENTDGGSSSPPAFGSAGGDIIEEEQTNGGKLINGLEACASGSAVKS